MSKNFRKTLWIVIRSVVCIGAMYWVLKGVTVNDYGTLPDGSRVRITDWQQCDEKAPIDECLVTVVGDGGTRTLVVGALARTPDGNPDFQVGLRTVLRSSDVGLLLVAVLLYAPVGIIQSVRFTWMIRSQDIQLSHWEGIKLTYAGNFLNFVALGTTGGDIFKAYYVSCHTDRKTEAVTTVFLDRAVGLISMVTVALTCMIIRFQDPKIREWWPSIAVLSAVLAAGTLVVFSRRVRTLIRFDRLLQRLPFSEQLQRIDAATFRMRHHKQLMAAVLLLTLVMQTLALTSMSIAGYGLGMSFSLELLPVYLTYLALALLIACIPISYQGGGTMDGFLQVCFGGTYGNYAQILFLGFAVRLLQLLWSLPGILVPITGAHRPSTEKIAQLQALTPASKS